MSTRQADARWEGQLKQGQGRMRLGSGAFEGPFSFGTRFEDEPGTNPEELIGAAHAGCFSMAFAAMLGEAGYEPESIETSAEVHLTESDDGFSISRIALSTTARVSKIDQEEFETIAKNAKTGCPVSKALSAVHIDLEARLES